MYVKERKDWLQNIWVWYGKAETVTGHRKPRWGEGGGVRMPVSWISRNLEGGLDLFLELNGMCVLGV
jgi:hypothetical protein